MKKTLRKLSLLALVTAMSAVNAWADDVAKIGDTPYETLAAAIASANDGQTITLLNNCSGGGLFIGPNKFASTGLTIDFGGFTYTVTTPVGSSSTVNQALHFENGNKITLTNGAINMTNDATALAAFEMFMQNYGTLIVDDMNIDGTGIAVATYDDPKYQAYPEWYQTEKPQFNYNTAGSSVIRNSTITMTGALGIDDAAALTFEDDAIINVSAIATKGTDDRYSSANPTVTVENGAQFTLSQDGATAFEALLNTMGQTLGTAENGVYTVDGPYYAKIVLEDGANYTITSDIFCGEATYQRSFDTNRVGKFQSWFVPFKYTITDNDVTNFDFFEINTIAHSPVAGSSEIVAQDKIWIHLNKLSAEATLTANWPYIFRPKAEQTDYKFTAENVTLKAKVEGRVAYTATMNEEYSFYGVYEPISTTSDNQFYYMNIYGQISFGDGDPGDSPVIVNPLRWIFKVSGKGQNSSTEPGLHAREVSFVVDGQEASVIRTVEAEGGDESYYTLDGVKVQQPAKGVYLKKMADGQFKKILIK